MSLHTLLAAYAYYGDKLGGSIAAASKAAPAVAVRKEPTSSALNPKDFVDFKLKNVDKLTHNTSRFTFELEEGQNLGLDIASCVVTKFTGEDGKPVIRPYTPTSDADHTGSFDFVIKRYEGMLVCLRGCAGHYNRANVQARHRSKDRLFCHSGCILLTNTRQRITKYP